MFGVKLSFVPPLGGQCCLILLVREGEDIFTRNILQNCLSLKCLVHQPSSHTDSTNFFHAFNKIPFTHPIIFVSVCPIWNLEKSSLQRLSTQDNQIPFTSFYSVKPLSLTFPTSASHRPSNHTRSMHSPNQHPPLHVPSFCILPHPTP